MKHWLRRIGERLMDKRRYSGLTVAQTQALGWIAMGRNGPFHPRTIEVLLDRGLVEPRKMSLGRDRFGEIIVTVYDMPPMEHIRYCQWCSDTLEATR